MSSRNSEDLYSVKIHIKSSFMEFTWWIRSASVSTFETFSGFNFLGEICVSFLSLVRTLNYLFWTCACYIYIVSEVSVSLGNLGACIVISLIELRDFRDGFCVLITIIAHKSYKCRKLNIICNKRLVILLAQLHFSKKHLNVLYPIIWNRISKIN